MQYRETLVKTANNAEIHICCQFFANRVLVQIRWNGELDTSYSVTCQDITQVLEELHNYGEDGEATDGDDGFYQDPLSNYQITTLFGDSNNLELPIIASQVSELFIKNKDRVPNIGSFVVMLSSKLFHAQDNTKFDTLLTILAAIKQDIIAL
ncbi:hypothetical protein ACO0RG_000846 [Hanseniaspora osmophila]